jgi:soluble lytic murein transglycosylase-like protein
MQIMPATARGLGYEGHLDMLYDADLNIGLGARLLSENFRQARGKWDAAISAYNAGWSRARPYDGNRRDGGRGEFVNQSYVDDVVEGWQYFNRQSPTPTVGQPAFTVAGKPSGKPGATTKPGATAGMGGGLAIAAVAGLAALLLLRR